MAKLIFFSIIISWPFRNHSNMLKKHLLLLLILSMLCCLVFSWKQKFSWFLDLFLN